MKFLLLILPLVFSFSIHEINSTWIAKENLTKQRPLGKIEFKSTNKVQSFVKSWDSRVTYFDCESLKMVKDQGYCNSAWAFSLTSTISDHICSTYNMNVNLSPQFLVSCVSSNQGCRSGSLEKAWNYTQLIGVVSDNCMPYQSYYGDVTVCIKHCVNHEYWRLYQVKSFKQFEWVVDAQLHIIKFGSVQAGMKVYKDFYYYASGIYRHVKGEYQGDHSVVLIGWGTLNGVDYWIAKNSWGIEWGMDGIFYIQRGTNECMIESALFGGEV